MAKDFKSDFLGYLGKHNKGPSWSIYFTTDLSIVCGSSITRTLVLSQLLYLCDKGKRKDGFFYRSHRKLCKETNISRMSVTRAIDWFKAQGFLEIKVKKVKGQPISHYRFDKGKLYAFGRAKIKEYNKKNCSKITPI